MFRTELHPVPSEWKIHYTDTIFSVGSCFAVHTGQLLLDHRFDALINPYGIVYNPTSVFELLNMTLKKQDLGASGFLINQGIARHYSLHSDISAGSREALLDRYIAVRDAAHQHLCRTKVLLITFGTASVFRHKETERIVANCHKMPSRLFDRYNLGAEQIAESFHKVYAELIRLNPGIRIILTVSPVRHLRDTLPGSQLTKSILRVACDAMVRAYDRVSYFPSYELMLDDLRDYRFYERDLLHPNDMAVDYIWEKFSGTFFDEETLAFIREWTALKKRLDHRPFHPGTVQHREFVSKTIDMLRQFTYKVDLSTELQKLESQLHERH